MLPQVLVTYPALPTDSRSLFHSIETAVEKEVRRSFVGELHFFFPGTAQQTEQLGPHTWVHVDMTPIEAATMHLGTLPSTLPTLWFRNGYVFGCPLSAWASEEMKPGKGLYLVETGTEESLKEIGVWAGSAQALQLDQGLSTSFFAPGRWVATQAEFEALPVAFQHPPRPCLFLDRDGVLIEDVDYPFRLTDFHPNLEMIPLLQWAQAQSWHRVILTNQAGLARGLFTMKDYEVFTAHLEDFFRSKGVTFDGVFHCPYHSAGTVPLFTRESVLRKPQPGMVLQACKRLPIDLAASFMIGDRASDAIALEGLRTLFLKGRYAIEGLSPLFLEPSAILSFLRSLG